MAESGLVVLRAVSHAYNAGTALARPALSGIDLVVPSGVTISVVGPTASGKTTLLQLLAGLIAAGEGAVDRAAATPYGVAAAMVFQRAESQLYCATVREDVGVGPACLGLVSSLVARRVDDALRLVGMDPEEFGPRNPHNLSLGEQRRVALAGVLAVEPRLLVLDEVGSGLDAGARRRIMGSLVEWREENPSRSLVFSTHVLEEAAEADRVVLLAQGRLLADGTPEEVLGDAALLESAGLEPTLSTRVALALGADAPCPVDARSLRNWLQKKVRP